MVSTPKTNTDDTVEIIAQQIEHYAIESFSNLKARLEESQTYYDNAIIDVLHLIGDENCRLNAVQLCKVTQKLQELERGHTKVKKELRRIANVMDTVYSIGEKADEFDYQPYKPKVIHNINELI